MTIFTIRSNELFGTTAESAVNTLNGYNFSYNVIPYDSDDPVLTPSFVQSVDIRISARPDAISYNPNSDGVVGSQSFEVFTNPSAVAQQTWFQQNLVGNQIRTIIHETIHASGNLDSRRDQILTDFNAQGIVIDETLIVAVEELLTRQATQQIDVASDLFRVSVLVKSLLAPRSDLL